MAIKANKNSLYKLILDQTSRAGIVLPLPASKKEIAFRGDERNVYHIGWTSGSREFMFWLNNQGNLTRAVFQDRTCVELETTLIPLKVLQDKGMVV